MSRLGSAVGGASKCLNHCRSHVLIKNSFCPEAIIHTPNENSFAVTAATNALHLLTILAVAHDLHRHRGRPPVLLLMTVAEHQATRGTATIVQTSA